MTEIEYTGPLKYFICGGVGGIGAAIIGHPFDTIKVRLQTTPILEPGKKSKRANTISCIKLIYKTDGILGFYRGLTAPIILVSPIFAFAFSGYKIGKQIFIHNNKNKDRYINYFKAGMFSGATTAIFIGPAERIKCLLQVQNDKHMHQYNGTIDCVVKLYKEGGLPNIFRGTVATFLRNTPGYGIYYATYEFMKRYLANFGIKEDGVVCTIISGGMSGINFWLLATPFDVLKSRLQTTSLDIYPNGMRDVVQNLLETQGYVGFYKGLTPVLLRAFPANAAAFMAFEFCKRMINLASA